MFKKATKKQLKARIALAGPAGSGKTYSALSIATGLGKKIAVVDTERESASLYSDIFDFDVCPLETGHPQKYIDAIEEAGKAGYDVLIIDSFSHAWDGVDGALELVDKATKRSRTKNSFTDGWGEVTPLHRRLLDAVLTSPCHVIVTMRSKMAYEMEERNGKKVPVKIGLQPIQRAGVEYEFTITADMNLDNEMVVSKTRCPKFKRAVIKEPGKKFGEDLLAWLDAGEPGREPEPQKETQATAPKNGEASKLDRWRAGWLNILGAQLFADVVGCSAEDVDGYVPPSDKAKRDAVIAALEAARRELDSMEAS
jgi:hypothetical protein